MILVRKQLTLSPRQHCHRILPLLRIWGTISVRESTTGFHQVVMTTNSSYIIYIYIYSCVFTHSCLFVLHGDPHTIFRKPKKHIFRQMFFFNYSSGLVVKLMSTTYVLNQNKMYCITLWILSFFLHTHFGYETSIM